MPKLSLMVIGLVVAVAGIALIGLGPQLGLERPEPLALCVFGIGLALVGLDGLVTGVVTQRVAARSVSTYGLVARLRGAAMSVAGIGIVIASVVELGGPGSLDRFLDQPLGQGACLMLLGLAGLPMGAAWLLGRERVVSSRALSALIALPARIAGLVIVLLSIALVAVGALRIISPGTLDAAFDDLLRAMGRR